MAHTWMHEQRRQRKCEGDKIAVKNTPTSPQASENKQHFISDICNPFLFLTVPLPVSLRVSLGCSINIVAGRVKASRSWLVFHQHC